MYALPIYRKPMNGKTFSDPVFVPEICELVGVAPQERTKFKGNSNKVHMDLPELKQSPKEGSEEVDRYTGAYQQLTAG